jgi:hypothetical protein
MDMITIVWLLAILTAILLGFTIGHYFGIEHEKKRTTYWRKRYVDLFIKHIKLIRERNL